MSQTEVQLIKNGAVVDADINGMSSSKLSGALPAISGAALTGITSAGKAHNLVINGAMLVAQRGTSSTAEGYLVDRFRADFGGTDEAPTFAQADVASGTTPYTSGFRKALKITNGNQTSGAGASDFIMLRYKAEAQDIANSGWNYTSSSSNVTLQFWIKSSVAQNFYGYLETSDGTAYLYPFETGSLSADTWTKVTKTISGNSNLTFNNDNGQGLILVFNAFRGTDTTGSVSLNAWGAYNSSNRVPDMTSTWYTTNDATLEITGIQLEVGDSATDFEHLSFAQDLALCQRYCQVFEGPNNSQGGDSQTAFSENCTLYQANNLFTSVPLKVSMRAKPSMSFTTGTNYYVVYSNGAGYDLDGSGIGFNGNSGTEFLVIQQYGTSLGSAGNSAIFRLNNTSAKITLSAEL